MNSRLVVLLDTCVLINLFNGECSDLLGGLIQYDFRITTHVEGEITDSGQVSILQRLIENEVVCTVSITDDQTNICIEQYMQKLAAGEASCIALAIKNNWLICTDDCLASKLAYNEMGPGKVLSTPGLILQAIRNGLISVDKADEIKKQLEEYRFRMSFGSFHDIV